MISQLGMLNLVSIHTPTKGVTAGGKVMMRRDAGFNPHTHEGCDQKVWWEIFQYDVSIHTPTKGVTLYQTEIRLQFQVSIHTPTKGVTKELKRIAKEFVVSIHTPTKGVTAYSANG